MRVFREQAEQAVLKYSIVYEDFEFLYVRG
mgnify:CR=1 FL=1